MHVTLPGMIIVVMYLALYFGLFGILLSFILKRSKAIPLLFFIPALWTTLEFIRSHAFSGFGWVLLGHSQSTNLPVIQIADILGSYGVSFLVVMTNAAIFLTIKDFRRKNYSTHCLGLALLVIFLSLSYGTLRVKNIFTGDMLRVAVVQGNIPQSQKWDAGFRQAILDKYEHLTKRAAEKRPDLIIWPETSVPGFLESEEEIFKRVKSIVLGVRTPLFIGAPSEGEDGYYYNSALLFDAGSKITGRYDKIHLVPFGEYIPFKGVFSFVENFAPNPIGDFRSGNDYKVFKVYSERSYSDEEKRWKARRSSGFSCLICFEDIFPELSRRFVKNGARFLVNMTNDAWFERTSAANQHKQSSVFRAVENRVNVVRAANTGVSCFIDQKGEVTDEVSEKGSNIFVDGFAVHDIILTHTRTFYTRFGDLFAIGCAIFTVLSLALQIFISKRRMT
jgi:apolipoprotein N-acyltransferase